jgi:hypothetical protein
VGYIKDQRGNQSFTDKEQILAALKDIANRFGFKNEDDLRQMLKTIDTIKEDGFSGAMTAEPAMEEEVNEEEVIEETEEVAEDLNETFTSKKDQLLFERLTNKWTK